MDGEPIVEAEVIFLDEIDHGDKGYFINLANRYSFAKLNARIFRDSQNVYLEKENDKRILLFAKIYVRNYFILFISMFNEICKIDLDLGMGSVCHINLMMHCNGEIKDIVYSWDQSIRPNFRYNSFCWLLSCLGCNHGEKYILEPLEEIVENERITSHYWFKDYFYLTIENNNKVIKWLPGATWVGIMEPHLKIEHKPRIIKVTKINSKETIYMKRAEGPGIHNISRITIIEWKRRRDGTHGAIIKSDVIRRGMHAPTENVLNYISYANYRSRKVMGLPYLDLQEGRFHHALKQPKKGNLNKYHSDLLESCLGALCDVCLGLTGKILPREIALGIIGR